MPFLVIGAIHSDGESLLGYQPDSTDIQAEEPAVAAGGAAADDAVRAYHISNEAGCRLID